jgi:uncharacterized low-complexity protein
MKAEEIDAVANWLYDNFNEKWDMHDKGMMCKIKNKNMKCGKGKCGSMKKPQKSEISQKMKCGQGKCGGK